MQGSREKKAPYRSVTVKPSGNSLCAMKTACSEEISASGEDGQWTTPKPTYMAVSTSRTTYNVRN